jgi:hypothetical protein
MICECFFVNAACICLHVMMHDLPMVCVSFKLEGTPFEFDCSEGEFADYDEKGECPVGLGKLESTFKVVSRHFLVALCIRKHDETC